MNCTKKQTFLGKKSFVAALDLAFPISFWSLACDALKDQLVRFNEQGKGIAAICAAPTVFAGLGLLKGKASTCNPGFWDALRADGADVIEDSKVVVNGNIITSQAMGTSVDFGLALVDFLLGKEAMETLKANIRF